MSHLFTLEGVDEAGAEYVGINRTVIGVYGNCLGSGGGGDHGHIDGICLAGNSNGVGCDNVADEGGDALVYLAVEGVDGLGIIALVVVGNELDLFAVDAALGVYLVKIEGSAVLYSQTVNGEVSGIGPQQADLDGIAGSGGAFGLIAALSGGG